MSALEVLGLLAAALLGCAILRSVLRVAVTLWLAPALGLALDFKALGRWAVVTGATDGIGKAFAFAFAKRGMNIVLISRNMEKLKTVAEEINSLYHVETKIIPMDFTNTSEKNYSEVELELNNLEIGVLVNNVGVSYPMPDYLLSLPDKEKIYKDIINCNIFSVINMTQIVLPGMVERHRGAIINISSASGVLPSPLLTVYGASKAYTKKFSKDLATEYSKDGIIVQCLVTGFVATKMSRIKKHSLFAPSPQQYVESALRFTRFSQVHTGYYPHSLMISAVKLLEVLHAPFAAWIVKAVMLNVREQAHRRRS